MGAKKLIKKSIAYTVVLGLVILVADASQVKALDYEKKEAKALSNGLVQVDIETLIPRTENIKLVSVGDIMMHDIQISGGYDEQSQSYAYDYMFEKVKDYVSDGDLTIGNLELTMAGAENGGYTGYPCFNSPESLGSALKNIGIDVLTTANNHSLDRRYEGVVSTINVLDKLGIKHTGTYKSAEESEEILIQKVKGAKIAFLAYTYGTNGIRPEEGKEYCVNYIDKDKIKKQIQKARVEGADIICVSPHYGQEYIRRPNEDQEDLVNFLVGEGVDIILGGHPHVLQPVEIRKTNYNGKEKEVVILYSQGNFVSAQRTRYREQSAVFDINLIRDCRTGDITVESVSYMPIWVDQTRLGNQYNFRVLPVKKSMAAYEEGSDTLISDNDYVLLKRALSDTREVLSVDDLRIIEK